MSTSPPNPESLLASHAWARRLARRLVRDASSADDLAQEAWLKARDGAPRGSLQAWLGGIVRNLARQRRRNESRRTRREAAAARPEALPSAAESLERLAAQQDVVAALLALAEPYRSTLVLRFHDDLPPRAIAARHGVPVATVKTRLARGLAQLRAALAKEHGGEERALALVLLPLARGSSIPWLATITAMNLSLKLAIVSAVVLGIVVWSTRREAEPRASEALADTRETVELELAEAPEAASPALPARQDVAVLPSADSRATTDQPAESVVALVTGVVLDVSGAPIGGVQLGVRDTGGVRFGEGPISGHILWREAFPDGRPPVGMSTPDGRFELERTGARVISVDSQWETVLAPSMNPGDEVVLVVAPRIRVSGRVTDTSGTPLADVDLRFDVPMHLVRSVGFDLGPSELNGWEARSDAEGRYAFERVPAVPGAVLYARLAPYELRAIEGDAWTDGELDIVLTEPEGGWLEGRIEARGAALAKATVALGYRATTSDERGRFRLSLLGLEREHELCVAAAGFLPVRLDGDRSPDGTVRWPDLVRVTLGDDALSLSGHVVDHEGNPRVGQKVALVDGGVLHASEQGFPVLLESVLAGEADLVRSVVTDEQGAFVLPGLDERDYRLRVIDPASALVFEAGPFAAGEGDLVLQGPAGAVWERVRGAVVDRDGNPIAGVHVRIDRDIDSLGVPGGMHYVVRADGAGAMTGADGTFELRNVPRADVVLHVYDAEVSDPELTLEPSMDPESFRIVCGRDAALEVVCMPPNPAIGVSVLDEAGEPLELAVPTSAGSFVAQFVELVDGRSPVMTLSDAGVLLVLYGEGNVELERVPIALRADGVNRVDL